MSYLVAFNPVTFGHQSKPESALTRYRLRNGPLSIPMLVLGAYKS